MNERNRKEKENVDKRKYEKETEKYN